MEKIYGWQLSTFWLLDVLSHSYETNTLRSKAKDTLTSNTSNCQGSLEQKEDIFKTFIFRYT